MRVLVETFNDAINSKTGIPLPAGKKRGTPEWKQFEQVLLACLDSLGHDVTTVEENPRSIRDLSACEASIHVHRTFRERPAGNLFYMQMHLRNLFTLSERGWGADNPDNLCGDLDYSDPTSIEWVEALGDSLHASGISKCDQPLQTSDTPPDFVLVPIQIPRDYTLKHHSPVTMKYFVDALQSWAHEAKCHVAFKLHPFNTFDHDLVQSVNEALASRYCHRVEGNIHELIKRSRGLFVVNSGTGFEGLIHGKPVCTFGACDYAQATWNADIRRLDEARNWIYSYDDAKRQVAYTFVHWYIHKHAYYLPDPSVPTRLQAFLQRELCA